LQASFRSFDKEGTFTVKAKYFVLCLGGIENPRILLNCQGGISSGIGNQYGIVGRYFGDHLHFTLGEVLYKKTPPARLFVGPTTELMDSSKTLNFGLRLEMPEAPDRMLRTIACSTSFTERLVRAMGKRPRCEPTGLLRIAAEQALNPNSRVELTSAKDRFGIRRVALNWQLSDTDYRTLRVAATEWAKFVAKQDLGRVRLDEWVLNSDSRLPSIREDEVLGNHHLCTTRMSSSPKEGVVDGNCRVHDLENLYIGGSSVFATGGASNPTYTIVQLALRLADHLNQRLG
jgi:choline dehydrogenase-like flavoprotein